MRLDGKSRLKRLPFIAYFALPLAAPYLHAPLE